MISSARRRSVRAMPASSSSSRLSRRSRSGGGGRGVTSEIVPDKEVAEHARDAAGTDDAERPHARPARAHPPEAEAGVEADRERGQAHEPEVQLALEDAADRDERRRRPGGVTRREPDEARLWA